MEREPEAQALLEALTEPTRGDTALLIATALASALPFLGGPAGTFVDEIRRNADTRMAEFVVDLAYGYRGIRRRLDTDYIRTEEFVGRLTTMIEEATLSRNRRKRDAYLAAGLNSGSTERPTQDEFELMTATLLQVETIHLEVLGQLMKEPSRESVGHNIEATWEVIDRVAGPLDLSVRTRVRRDLEALELIDSRYLVTEGGPDEEESPTLVTPFGHRFLAFVARPTPDEEGIMAR